MILKALSHLTVRHLAVALYRVSQRLGRRAGMLGSLVKQVNHVVTGADIAWEADLGPNLTLFHPTGVVIGPHVRAGASLTVQGGVTIGGMGSAERRADSPTLGDGVRVGAGAKILGPISIGDGAEIGANAVVLQDVPSHHVAVGVPARPRPRRA